MNKAVISIARSAARWMPAWMKQALYRLGPISRALRNVLNNSLPKDLQIVEISGGILRGQHMQLDLQSEKDFWLGSYEMPLISALKRQSRVGMRAYDVGANVGYLSLAMAALLGTSGKVFAFEALPDNVQRLQKNTEINRLTSQIEIIPKAVGAKSGPATFLVHHSGGMGKLADAGGRTEQYEREIAVQTIALDDFVFAEGHPPPHMLKIDIEGAEGHALAGMRRILKESRPMLFIELHGPAAAKSVWQELSNHSYTIHAMRRGFPKIKSLNDLDWKSYIYAEAAS